MSDQLMEVFRDTVVHCQNDARSFSNIYNPKLLKRFYCEKKWTNTTIQVVNADVLVVAEQNKGYFPLVLNLASSRRAGGGVEYGAMAQEEELFRRTNYFLSLDKHFYPLPPTSVIYTDRVMVIKNAKYELLETPFPVSMIAAAAICNPVLENGQLSQHDTDTTYYMLECVFKSALLHGKDTLILGAIGCGAYRNPPFDIIRIFNSLIETYRGYFKKVVFAVYSRNDNNFELFDKHIWR